MAQRPRRTVPNRPQPAVHAPVPLPVAASILAPAALLRWGVSKFDATVRSPQVTGNTVVSSVNRGPADLRLGGAPVLLTASYPALSPMMGLTHGVHGIGDTVAVSVHDADSVMAEPDLDDYLERLRRALGAVVEWAFTDLDLFRLELGHRTNNPASGAVAEAVGFVPEGVERAKLRYGDERFDVRTMALLATDPRPADRPGEGRVELRTGIRRSRT